MSQYNVHIVEPTTIDAAGFKARRGGLEVRDCLLILEPGGSKRLGILVREPMETTVVENYLREEEGVLDIDGSRIGSSTKTNSSNPENHARWGGGAMSGTETITYDYGRFPANLLLRHGPSCYCDGTKKVKPSNGSGTAHQDNKKIANQVCQGEWNPRGVSGTTGFTGEDGKEEVANWVCEQGCPVGVLDRQSGNRPSTLARLGHGGPNPAKQRTKGTVFDGYTTNTNTGHVYGDEGGASRFFKQVQTEEELESYLDTLVRKGHEI